MHIEISKAHLILFVVYLVMMTQHGTAEQPLHRYPQVWQVIQRSLTDFAAVLIQHGAVCHGCVLSADTVPQQEVHRASKSVPGKKQSRHAASMPAQSPICKQLLCRLVKDEINRLLRTAGWVQYKLNVSSSKALVRVHMYLAAGVCCSSLLAKRDMRNLTTALKLLTLYLKQPAVLQSNKISLSVSLRFEQLPWLCICAQVQLRVLTNPRNPKPACMQRAMQAWYTCACYFLQESCDRQRHLGDRKNSRDHPAAIPGMPPVSQPSVASHSQQQATGTNLCASSLITYKLTTGWNAVLACKLDWIKNEVGSHRRQMQEFCCQDLEQRGHLQIRV